MKNSTPLSTGASAAASAGRRRAALIALALCAAVFVVLPFVLPSFRVSQLGKFLSLAILAVGLNILWGYAGILSLGQGLFFVLGGYAMALHLKLTSMEAGSRVPDFMQWSGIENLPVFYLPFYNFFFSAALMLLLPMAVAAAVGYVIFTSRIRGVYFTIISQALALALATFLTGQQPYTGGANGITNFKGFFGASLRSAGMITSMYYVTFALLAAVLLLWYWFSRRRAGLIFSCLKDEEDRLRFLGYNTVRFKVAAYVMAAALSGLAGGLFVTHAGIISPSQAGIVPSVEIAVWVILGGRGTVLGPVAGALSVNYLKSFLSENIPTAWLYVLGLLLIACVLFLPDGIMSLIKKIRPQKSLEKHSEKPAQKSPKKSARAVRTGGPS